MKIEVISRAMVPGVDNAINPSVKPLEERNNQFLQIQELIDKKRDYLYKKQKKLKSIEKQNIFLGVVRDDYRKYHSYITKQKQDQIEALQIINNYINDLTESGKLSKYNIEDAKVEQEKIMQEVDSIRAGLDDIMNDTDYIGTELKKKLA
jgi:hypothetical protein